jgi:hypothetical protein
MFVFCVKCQTQGYILYFNIIEIFNSSSFFQHLVGCSSAATR